MVWQLLNGEEDDDGASHRDGGATDGASSLRRTGQGVRIKRTKRGFWKTKAAQRVSNSAKESRAVTDIVN